MHSAHARNACMHACMHSHEGLLFRASQRSSSNCCFLGDSGTTETVLFALCDAEKGARSLIALRLRERAQRSIDPYSPWNYDGLRHIRKGV